MRASFVDLCQQSKPARESGNADFASGPWLGGLQETGAHALALARSRRLVSSVACVRYRKTVGSSAVQNRRSIKSDAITPGSRPSTRRIAAIDLGSRNFKAVIGENRGGRVVARLLGKRLVRLGKDVADHGGLISRDTLAQARRALVELLALCEREGSTQVLAVATRAVRKAGNGRVILDMAGELGLEVEIATGEREAELGYLAVTGGDRGKLVCELGSHSMQIAWRISGAIESISIAAGYERIYPEYIEGAHDFVQARKAYTAFLEREVRELCADSRELIGIAMNTMACFVTGKQKNDVTNRYLGHDRIRDKVQALTEMSQEAFASLKAETPKVDKILPGLILLDYLLERTGHRRALIAEAELPVGLIVEAFERDGGD